MDTINRHNDRATVTRDHQLTEQPSERYVVVEAGRSHKDRHTLIAQLKPDREGVPIATTGHQ